MESQNIVSARVLNLIQLLEKLHTRINKRNVPDDLQQLRYTAGKLYHVVCQQERSQKDLILKETYNLELLCRVLESRVDKHVTENCLLVLQELLGKTQTGKRCSYLINAGVPNVLLRLMVEEAKERDGSHQIIFAIHHILAKVGPKDRKFCVKARLNGALLVTSNLIKTNFTNSRLVQCLLSVLKIYSLNSINASYLGKHGTVLYLFKVLDTCGRRSVKPLKLILETLANLTKLKNNCARVISLGGVQLLLPMYQEWMQNDTRNRQVDLRKNILVILKNITNLDAGRKGLVESNGIRILYESAQEGVDCKEVESMIILASVIMRRCCPQDTLPVDSIDSPILYRLPRSDFHKPQSLATTYDLACGLDLPNISGDPTPRSLPPLASTSDSTSLEDDDCLDSEEDRGKNDNSDDEDESKDSSSDVPYTRTIQDLRMYDVFFPEMFEITPSDNESTILDEEAATSSTDSFFADHKSGKNSPSPRQRSDSLFSYNLTKHESLSSSFTESFSSRYLRLDSSHSEQSANSHFSLVTQKMFEFPHLSEPKCDLFYPSSMRTPRDGVYRGPQSTVDFNAQFRQAAASPNKKTRSTIRAPRVPSSRRMRRSQTESGLTTEFNGTLTISGLSPSSQGSSDSSEVVDAIHDTATCLRDPITYSIKSLLTKSVQRFSKLAHPDYSGTICHAVQEPLYHRKLGVQRAKIFEDIQRMIEPENIYNRVVYDLDTLVTRTPRKACSNPSLTNNDADRVGDPAVKLGSLSFNSQFECGNLRKAIQVRDVEYDLLITPDVNTDHHHQWFYFEVSNMVGGVAYRFNIVNCEKVNSQFNFGMRPVMYSVSEAMQGRPFWMRTGSDICYYRNHFSRSTPAVNGNNAKGYYTTTFSVTFPHSRDVCYLAYHYPYTYTTLMTQITEWERRVDRSRIYLRHQTLCTTVAGNSVPVLTITAHPDKLDEKTIAEFKARPYVFLSARVHPGESNSSWVMKGSIDFLLSDLPAAQVARESFIFKIVPMLNPDGVINGNHRCSLTGEDLNRRWQYPCPNLHPTIYHTKGLLMFMNTASSTPFVFCDYHGHSRRKNVFLYGCAASQSWCSDDKHNPPQPPTLTQVPLSHKGDDTAYRVLPKLLQQMAPAFSYSNCSFTVEKVKETTARVVVWREIGVARSYTMESSYCGCDQGPYKDYHISIHELKEMGHKFCEALTRLEGKEGVTDSTRDAVIYMPSENLPSRGLEGAKAKADDDTSPLNIPPGEHFINEDVSDFEEADIDNDKDNYDKDNYDKDNYDEYDFDIDDDDIEDDSDQNSLFITEGGF